MDQQLIERLLALVDRTGDRVIIIDPISRRPFVLMGLSSYEGLLSGERVQSAPEPSMLEGIPLAEVSAPNMHAASVRGDATTPVSVFTGSFGAPHVVASQFAPEPLTAALPDDDRFYVEPLEG